MRSSAHENARNCYQNTRFEENVTGICRKALWHAICVTTPS